MSNDANGTSGYVVAHDEWLVNNMNSQGSRKKWSCPRLTYYRNIYLEGPRKTKDKIMMLHNSVFTCLVCRRQDIF
jgi:hypothetical protein